MSIPPSSERSRWLRSRLVGFVAAAVVTGVLISIPLDYIESLSYDLRMRWRPAPQASQQIELVMIRPSTVTHFKGNPDAAAHLHLFQQIFAAQPKAVVYLRRLAPLQGAELEKRNAEELRREYLMGSDADQKALANFLAAQKNFTVQTEELRQVGEAETLRLMPPFEPVRVLSGPRTADRNILARDGVTRRLLLNYQNQKLLHWQIAELFNPRIQERSGIHGLFDLFDSQQVQIDFLPPGSFPSTLFEDVTDGHVDTSRFRDKLVLIGMDTGTQIRDYVATPYDRDQNLPLVELHANMFDTLIRNSAPAQVSRFWDILFTFVISMITIFFVMGSRPAKGMGIVLITTLGFLLIGYLSFWLGHLWLPMVHPLGTIFLCYYFLIPYRLIVENRLSWEYYQKHKLLQQVEELKTNFISMMSHDLKTPIARIQGMTELIRKDPQVLSSPQVEAVDSIRSSASELLGFINSILNYARIESQGVVLQRVPKDPNQLLEEVVRRHEFLATAKKMRIRTELEPLFSLSVDPDLLKQVFSNLLENAIKYSPEGSEVIVRSQELDGKVQVSFTDQGPGIPTDEQDFLFEKFFRSRNAKSSPIKGSGLGLYLAKYFVELHNGHVFVTSALGKGSTFTVQLPLQI